MLMAETDEIPARNLQIKLHQMWYGFSNMRVNRGGSGSN